MPSQRTTRRQVPGASPPERRTARPAQRPTANGFYNAPVRILLGGAPETLTVCGVCCAFVPGGEKAQRRHMEWHRLLQAAIDTALPR
jgi:hypothetical protein